MFFKKRKEKKKTVAVFKQTVDRLWTGIHNLDCLIAKIIQKHDVTPDTALFVQRSTDDLISVLLIYKESKLFHVYNEQIINKAIPVMQKLMNQIVQKARNLFSLHNLHELIKEQKAHCKDDSDFDYVVQMANIESEFHQIFNNVLDDYMSMREFILTIRTVVSRDKMAILCGADLYLLYEHNEKLFKQSISHEVRFDKIELKKQIKEKAGVKNE